MPRTMEERFWSKVDIQGPDECWEWRRSRNKKYGQFRVSVHESPWKASRVAWMLTNGHPGELYVLHRCDNPPCCNPRHLFLGTHADNAADMVSKGRSVRGRQMNRKISSEQLDDVEKRREAGESLRSIAPTLNTSHSTLSRMLSERNK